MTDKPDDALENDIIETQPISREIVGQEATDVTERMILDIAKTIVEEASDDRDRAISAYAMFHDMIANGNMSDATESQLASLIYAAVGATEKKVKVLQILSQYRKSFAKPAGGDAKGKGNTTNIVFEGDNKKELLRMIEKQLEKRQEKER